MRWLWKPFSQLQEALEEDHVGTGDATHSTRSKSTLRPQRINDHVYEVYKPAGRPSVELVFFHGLQLEPGFSEDAHINTWISQDKSQSWLTWLVEDLPDVRILTISYDAAARTTKSEGRLDMYVTSENLVYALTGDSARVGQDGCPVVLVGHCLGGLVMKELCSKAHHMIRLQQHSKPVENLLANLKGLFFYATPHHGSLLVESNSHSLTGALIHELRSLDVNTARSNEDFRQLRISKGWKTFGVGGLLPVKLKLFEGIVVPEASARSDMDDFYAAAVDHYNVCRPVNKKSSTYQLMLDFAHHFVEEYRRRQEEEARAKAIEDIPEVFPDEGPIWTSELSSPQLWGLRAVVCLLVAVHIFMFYIISVSVISTGFESITHETLSSFPKVVFPNEGTDPRKVFEPSFSNFFNGFFSMAVKQILLKALNLLSVIVTPFSCVYLLRFYMTRRWAHPLGLVSELLDRPLLLDVWWTQPSAEKQDEESVMELLGSQQEDSKLEVGSRAPRKEESNLGVGSRQEEDLKLEVEPLLLEQQSESQVELVPLLPPSEVETKIDVDPLLGPSKQTRRLRSRGTNTNKVGPNSPL
ncbi:unnamed protein product [Calypogeia fissa]